MTHQPMMINESLTLSVQQTPGYFRSRHFYELRVYFENILFRKLM